MHNKDWVSVCLIDTHRLTYACECSQTNLKAVIWPILPSATVETVSTGLAHHVEKNNAREASQLSLSLFIGLDHWRYFRKCHLNSLEIKFCRLCEMFEPSTYLFLVVIFSSPFFCPADNRLSFFLTEAFLARRKIRSCLHDTLVIWHLFPKIKCTEAISLGSLEEEETERNMNTKEEFLSG